MSEEIKIYFDEDGIAKEYDDTYDITIHCESEEEQNELFDRLNSSEKPDKWIPVSERYPEDGQRVLVDYCDEDMGIMLMRFNAHGYRGFKAWMPLPEPYKQEVEE